LYSQPDNLDTKVRHFDHTFILQLKPLCLSEQTTPSAYLQLYIRYHGTG
jgi:hypothetical protein